MGKVYEELTPALQAWIAEQHLFFVATAPLSEAGWINCSPKGMDSLRVLGPRSVAYLDLTGSGVETIAHLRENGRIVIMFCSFVVPPKIVRLHGLGRPITPGMPEWPALAERFPNYPGARAIITIEVHRIADSCGFGVPLMDYRGERDTLLRSSELKGPAGLAQYRAQKNSLSLNNLPGLDPNP